MKTQYVQEYGDAFSLDDTGPDEFEGMKNVVDLEAIPEAILNVYKENLK